MFDTKKKSLFTARTKSTNAFVNSGLKDTAKTLSGNGSVKFDTTGDMFVDQFSNFGTYKSPRSYDKISLDCQNLWDINPELAVKFTIYTRMISRKSNVGDNKFTVSGAELKHEGIMRMIWLAINHSEVFWKNIALFVSVGSVKDIFVMLRYDLMYHGWDNRQLDWNKMGNLISQIAASKSTMQLLRKYLPQIKSNSKCTTLEAQANNIVAKYVANTLGLNAQQYRTYKSSGTAHSWQQLISNQRFSDVEFDKIHGRALSMLVKSKFLHNHELSDRYSNWISGRKSVSYTGYVHELLCELDNNRDLNFVETVNKQFNHMVESQKDSDMDSSMIVVRDTSGSMDSTAIGTKYKSASIAKAMSIYFSKFLSGPFADCVINFNSKAKLHKFVGKKASTIWNNDGFTHSMNTSLTSVCELFGRIKADGVSESDFPGGILCISDGEFDRTGEVSNVTAFRNHLLSYGFSREYVNNFKFVFWDIPNGYYYGRDRKPKFETYGNVKNVFYMSGYSASNIKFAISNKVETAKDIFNNAMGQDVLKLVNV